MSSPEILLIDDDRRLADMVGRYLGQAGFAVQHQGTAREGLETLGRQVPGLVLLDLMLPDGDGLDVCRQIRQMTGAAATVPVLMLTARGETTDRIVGLEIGADDYLPKPFEPRELVARVQTVLRRFRAASSGGGADSAGVHPEDASVLRFEGLVIDPVRRSVLRHDEEVALTGTEYELLLMLAREPGRVFSRDDILGRLRGHEVDLYSRAVDIVVSRLRRKLEPLVAIKTLRNVGYALALRRQEA